MIVSIQVSLAGNSLAAEDWRAMLSSRVGDKMFNFTKQLGITGNLILLFYQRCLIVLYICFI